MKYSFIRFEYKQPEWVCLCNKDGAELGRCFYYRQWRQWVFSQKHADAVFSAGCLQDIAGFLRQLN